MIRAHFFDSPDPVKEGSTLIANCMAEVPNAHFVFLWDNENFPEFLSVSMGRICPKCRRLKLEQRYIYGIVSSQEWMDAQREEEMEVA